MTHVGSQRHSKKKKTCINLKYELKNLEKYLRVNEGTRWRSWLRHCATSRKVAGSIPDGVIGFFH